MTGLTSRQPWYEHHWYSGELTGECWLSVPPSVHPSVSPTFTAVWVSEHYSINGIYHTPHLPIKSYYKTSNPPAYMPCFLHLLPLLFFLSFFHCRASQVVHVGKNQLSATAAFLFHIPSFHHYTFYPVPEVSEFGLLFLSGLFLSFSLTLSLSRSLSPVFILFTLPGVQVVKDDALLWLLHGCRLPRGRVAVELQSAGCSGK